MKRNNTWLLLAILNAAIVAITSVTGLTYPGLYSHETVSWREQALGQDFVILVFVVPALLWTGYRSRYNNRIARSLFAGIQLFLVYSFIIYGFSIHFNTMFLMYCFALSVSLYSFIFFLLQMRTACPQRWFEVKIPIKLVSWFFIIMAAVFFFMWISQVVAAMVNNSVPDTLIETGLPSNPVHVLDLAVYLPGMYITGWMLLNKRRLGYLLLIPMLAFIMLMNLNLVVLQAGIPGNTKLHIDGILTIFMTMLLITILVGIQVFRNIRKEYRSPEYISTIPDYEKHN
jgi:ABC-type antimicrobial peptide transport system permease subunit